MEQRTEQVANDVIGAAIEVHKSLGPGYRESVYGKALAVELELKGIQFQPQVPFALIYKGRPVGVGRLDFLVEGCLIVELKSVEAMAVVHRIQVLSYLKATGHHLGLLINFNVPILKAGIQRVIL